MAGCYFRATGKEFDVDTFLADSTLEPEGIYHEGEPVGLKGKVHPFTGFSVTVSETWGDLRAQVPDAVAFLRENELELVRLAKCPGVSEMRLDFPYSRREGAAVQSDSLPPELLVLAGSLGITIELTLYPSEKDWNEMFGPDSASDADKNKDSLASGSDH